MAAVNSPSTQNTNGYKGTDQIGMSDFTESLNPITQKRNKHHTQLREIPVDKTSRISCAGMSSFTVDKTSRSAVQECSPGTCVKPLQQPCKMCILTSSEIIPPLPASPQTCELRYQERVTVTRRNLEDVFSLSVR